MDCTEFQEVVAPAVDRLLMPEEMASFLLHAETCKGCRREYELELATKALLSLRARRVRTPECVLASIAENLRREDAQPVADRGGRFRRFLRMRFVKPTVGLILAFALVVAYLVSPRQPAGSASTDVAGSNDVIAQSLTNYSALVSGNIKPQFLSSQTESMKGFFAGKTEFPVQVPAMRDCDLVGGVVNNYSGVPLAHVVYRRGGELIYMYQACWDVVQRGEKLHLPDAVRSELQRTGWYSQKQANGNTVVLWTKGATICAAVARMSKEDLVACLTSANRTDRSEW